MRKHTLITANGTLVFAIAVAMLPKLAQRIDAPH